MPVRSSSSSVLIWPDQEMVEQAAREWAEAAIAAHPELVRLGYFGSYARGDWGVGSDLDLIAVVAEAWETFERRGLTFDLLSVPVPAEILVYTQTELDRLRRDSGRFARMVDEEVVWLYERKAVQS
jgi:predicted nucleotidyltransferase